MWRATIKGVLARKVRLCLTALAVVLGVTFVSGTYVLTDTLHASLGEIFQQYASGSDLVVAAPHQVGDRATSRQRIPVAAGRCRCARSRGRAADAVPHRRREVHREGQPHGDPALGRGHARHLVGRRGFGGPGPAGRGPAPGPRRRGRDGRRHREPLRLRGRRPGAGAAHRRGRAVPDRRDPRARRPGGPRVRQRRRVRPEDRRARVRRRRAWPTSSSCAPNRGASLAERAARDPCDAVGGGLEVRPGQRVRGRSSQQQVDEFLSHPQRPAARLRRHRAARRRLHHLQHLHDPGGATDARARPVAGDGGVGRAGGRLGAGRGARSWAWSRPSSASALGRRARQAACCGCCPGFGVPVPDRAFVVLERTVHCLCGRRRSASRCWRRSFPRSARRGRRRSPRSATCASRAQLRSTVGARDQRRARHRRRRRRSAPTGSGGPRPLEQAVAITFVGGFVIFVGIVVLGPLGARPLAAIIGRPLPDGVRRDRHARPRQRDAQSRGARRSPRPHSSSGSRWSRWSRSSARR